MEKLRACVVGVGKIGAAHIEAIGRLDCAELAAVVVRDDARARELRGLWGAARRYADHRSMLAAGGIDVVHDCTPNAEHFEIGRDCILAGRHVLSEKPLAVDSRDSGELAGLLAPHNAMGAVNFVYRHYSILGRLRGMIGRGELGEIRAVRGAYLQDWLLRDTDFDWRVEAARGGPSRAMADIGSHWCDLACFLIGQDIAEVCADIATFIPERIRTPPGGGQASEPGAPPVARRVTVDTEDYASVLLRFSGGARGSFTVSQTSAGRKTDLSIEIDGSEASARWERLHAEKLWIGRRDEPARELSLPAPETQRDAQRNMIESFYRSILYGEAPRYADFAQGHRMVKIVEAVMESGRSRSWRPV